MRILISGYYGFANTGDEAILAGLLAGLRASAPTAEVTVLSADPDATTRDHAVAALPRGIGSVRRAVREADLLISGGGGLLQDATSWRSPLYYLAVIELARRAGVPVALLAQGIGPLERGWVRDLVRRVLDHADLITVRDEASQRELAQLGVRAPVTVTADASFLLTPAPEIILSEVRRAEAWPENGKPVIGVTLRPTLRPPTEAWLGAIAHGLDHAAQEWGATPVFISMQPPGDALVAEEVRAKMTTPARVLQAGYDPATLLGLIGSVDLLVGMRLHSLLFAARQGVPMVGLSYDPKIDAAQERFGISTLPLREVTTDGVAAAIRHTWTERDSLRASLRIVAAAQRAAAQSNIDLALALARPTT
jgi:polysaccharide pyruvyl transferase CsaB